VLFSVSKLISDGKLVCVDIWLLPAVGRRARRASRHRAEPRAVPRRPAFWHILVAALTFTAASRACGSRWVFLCLFLFSFRSLITPGKSQGKELPFVAGAGGSGGGGGYGTLQRSKLACAELLWPVPQPRERNRTAGRDEHAPVALYPFSPSSQSQVAARCPPGCIRQPSRSWHWGNSNNPFASFFFFF